MQDNTMHDNMTAPLALLMNALKCSLSIYAKKVKPALVLLVARVWTKNSEIMRAHNMLSKYLNQLVARTKDY